MTKLYPFEHQFVKDNYPLVYKIFSTPSQSDSKSFSTQTSNQGYLYFKKQLELLKQRQSDKA